MNPTYPGRLIVFEGIDGTGKTTQIQLTAKALGDRGIDVVCTKEPTDGEYGQQIREIYQNRYAVSREQELELFVADRLDHVHTVLEPMLTAGRIILCDRYFLSTVAYQGAAGLEVERIIALNRFAPQPDLALLFEAPPAMGITRITSSRGEQPNDFEQAKNLTKVAAIFASLKQPYIRRIDATGSIDTVHQAVMQEVDPLIHQYQSR